MNKSHFFHLPSVFVFVGFLSVRVVLELYLSSVLLNARKMSQELRFLHLMLYFLILQLLWFEFKPFVKYAFALCPAKLIRTKLLFKVLNIFCIFNCN